jgi:PBSX family phage terminase large subunit
MLAHNGHESPSQQTVQFWPRGASADLIRNHSPEVVVSGPAGTGKTFCALWKLHLAASKYAGMRGIMVRKTLESLTASALVTYQNRVLGTGDWGVRPFGGSKLKPAGFQYPNGSEILIGGLDKANKVMSQEYDLIYVNEATELTEEDWETLTTRARYGVMPYQQLFGDCNPQGPGHWLYKRANDGRTVMLFSDHKENPEFWDGEKWTDRGTEYLAQLGRLTGFRRDRLLLGKWTAAEGAVYPGFDRRTHVREMTDEQLEGWNTVLGLDVGSRNPTSLSTYRYAGDRLHKQREVYRPMDADEIYDAVEQEYHDSKAQYLVIDPSSKLLIEPLRRRGMKVRLGKHDIIPGINTVTSVLNDFTIDPSCENTIIEFETYRYPSGSRSTSDTPVKDNDHAMDELRYVCMELYGKPKPKAVAAVGIPHRSTWT